MAYTTRELITDSYYKSGIVARQLQTVSGQQITDGLTLLNDLLAIKTADSPLIPYYTEYDFTAVTGQQEYFIPNLIAAQTVVFFIGDVRYQMYPVTRKAFYGTGRVDNIDSLPFNYHVERKKGGSSLWLYFYPNQNFPMTLWGKFSLTSVTLDQDLSLILDQYYIVYLKWGLTEYICTDNNITMTPQNYQKLKEAEKMITNVSPPDLSLTKVTAFGSQPGLTFADVNLGNGWRPA